MINIDEVLTHFAFVKTMKSVAVQHESSMFLLQFVVNVFISTFYL